MNPILEHAITATISAVIGLIFGVLIGEPLKKVVNGQKRLEKKQKLIEDMLAYMRDNNEMPTTEELHDKFKPGKELTDTYGILRKLAAEGRVKRIASSSTEQSTEQWLYKF